jgi:glutathione synthase/RimK-type ligase-like ATP-grasp enzyme
MDDRYLPELNGLSLDSPAAVHCRQFHEQLMCWIEISSACVVNRSSAISSNVSKPYQAQLIQKRGFLIPETLVTNDPDLVRDFHAKHGKTIYKSISAARSIVETLRDSDFDRIENIRWCPVQFQEFIEGVNVRVHVAGDEAYATAVTTEATDYRYAMEQSGEHAQLREVELSQELADRCVELTRSLGLTLSGIDLIIAPNDDVFCLEVNPCPAFSYYECNTGQPISAGIAHCLMNPSVASRCLRNQAGCR